MKKSYLLHVNADLYNEFKAVCAMQNKTIKRSLTEMIKRRVRSAKSVKDTDT